MRAFIKFLAATLLLFSPSAVFAQSANPFNPDYAWCATQGSIATRGATTWNCLTPGTSGQVLRSNGAGANVNWLTVSGTGSVTSVGLTMPAQFSVTGSPVTTSGTLAASWASQTANTLLAAPNGSSGTPTFRNVVGADFGSQTQGLVLASPAASTGNASFRNIVGSDFGSQTQNLILASPNGSSGSATFRAQVAADMPNAGVSSGGNISGTWPALTANITVPPDFVIGHRLTLTSGTPVMTAAVIGATTIYSTPYTSNLLSLWNGSAFINTACAQTSQLLLDTTKSPAAAVSGSNYDLFAWNDSGTCRVTRGPVWTSDGVRSLAISQVNGTWVNSGSITNGPASGFGTYMGTIRTGASATVSYAPGSAGTTTCAVAQNGIWNMYNPIHQQFYSSAPFYTGATTSATLIQVPSCQMNYVRGFAREVITAQMNAVVGVATGGKGAAGVQITCASGTDASDLGTIGVTGAAADLSDMVVYSNAKPNDVGFCSVIYGYASDGTNNTGLRGAKSFMQTVVEY